MSIIKSSDKRLSLNVQHSYITLRTPNGNYTYGYGGSKASGNLCSSPTGFENLENFISNSKNFLDGFKELLKPSVLSTVWKEWDNVVKTNEFKPTDKVKLTHPMFIKKYPNTYKVESVKRKTVYLETEKGIVGFDYQVLEKL